MKTILTVQVVPGSIIMAFAPVEAKKFSAVIHRHVKGLLVFSVPP
jgi:hypothetical protein